MVSACCSQWSAVTPLGEHAVRWTFLYLSGLCLLQAPEWLVYHDVTLTTQEYIREATVIKSSWLTEIASHYFELRKPDAVGGPVAPAAALAALRTGAAPKASASKKRKPEFGTMTRDDVGSEEDDDGGLPLKIVFKGKQQGSSGVFATVPRKKRTGLGL
jgi:hypothetical protein